MSCSEWRRCTLGDLVKFQRGHDLSKSKMVDGVYPVTGSNGIIGYHNEYTTEAPCITIGRSGNVGTPYYYNQKCWAHNTTLYIKEFYDVDPKFIYYYLKTLNLGFYASGSAVPTLNRNHIHPIEVCIPENINEQKKISYILSLLDEKIELNNEMNKTLEEMAQALFKRWFVDFEFPDEEGKPYKSSGGEMVESEMGMIPKGWNVKKLGQLGKIVTGKTPSIKDKENYGESFNFITPVDMNGDYYIINSQRKLSPQGYQKVSNLLIPKNSIGVTCIGSNLGEVYLNAKESFTNQQINSLILNNQKYYPYVYTILKNMKNDFLNIAGGSAVPIINKTTFSGINIICPNDELLNIYCEKVSCFFNKIKENLINNDALVELRNFLLPKLMSGEIRVNDIEANL